MVYEISREYRKSEYCHVHNQYIAMYSSAPVVKTWVFYFSLFLNWDFIRHEATIPGKNMTFCDIKYELQKH